MTDRPILFSAPMIRALLDGRKTQTRRIIKPQPNMVRGVSPTFSGLVARPYAIEGTWRLYGSDVASDAFNVRFRKGDRLYVRETWRAEARWDGFSPSEIRAASPIYYAANQDPRDSEPGCAGRIRSGIHMPRWASRLTLTVTDVRVQRLQEISETDAAAEGAERLVMDDEGRFYQRDNGTHRCGFAGLWAHINGAGSWDANPWIFALTFTVERRNIDT